MVVPETINILETWTGAVVIITETLFKYFSCNSRYLWFILPLNG